MKRSLVHVSVGMAAMFAVLSVLESQADAGLFGRRGGGGFFGHHRSNCCQPACEPAPACGCAEPAPPCECAEPAPADCGCASDCGCHSGCGKRGGRFRGLFNRGGGCGCDSGCGGGCGGDAGCGGCGEVVAPAMAAPVEVGGGEPVPQAPTEAAAPSEAGA